MQHTWPLHLTPELPRQLVRVAKLRPTPAPGADVCRPQSGLHCQYSLFLMMEKMQEVRCYTAELGKHCEKLQAAWQERRCGVWAVQCSILAYFNSNPANCHLPPLGARLRAERAGWAAVASVPSTELPRRPTSPTAARAPCGRPHLAAALTYERPGPHRRPRWD